MLQNHTTSGESRRICKHLFARTCVQRVHSRQGQISLVGRDCDIQRCGQQRWVIQREIVDGLQHHQRTSVTADLRASRCSPQRKIRTFPEMRSTLSRNVTLEILPLSRGNDDLTSVIPNQPNPFEDRIEREEEKFFRFLSKLLFITTF